MVGMMVCHIFLSTCLVIKLVISIFYDLGLVLEKVFILIELEI